MWWKPGDSVPVIDHAERFDIQPSDVPILYKMHGGLAPNGDWIQSVITEDYYFDIGGKIYSTSLLPVPIRAVLGRSSLLFLGYSLRDVHVRFLVSQSARRSSVKDYLVSKNISRMDQLRFERLGIVGIELTITDFLGRLVATRTS